MEITCVACARPMSITGEQIGRLVQCPTCHSKLLLRRTDQLLTESLVTCPGCAVKLALPRTSAEIFRCPKCSQQLREPGAQSLVDVWRHQDLAFANQSLRADTETRHPGLLRTSRSVKKPSPDYSQDVQSVGPGGLLCAQALIALFINGFQLLATEEITEHVADADMLRTRYVATAVFGAIYQAPILLGAIQMIMRRYLWVGRLASMLAVIPVTIFTYGVYWYYFAFLLYPIALVGGIWGMLELFRDRRGRVR